MTVASDTLTVEAPSPAGTLNLPSVNTKPFVDATQSAYERVAGGVEWYFEHWVDLVEEIRAEQAAGQPKLSVADIMAALPEAKVASDIPGRVRLRLPELKGQKALAAQCTEALANLQGVNEVHVSPVTGSILALYDTGQHGSLQELLHSMGM
jgi:hypothetical protein